MWKTKWDMVFFEIHSEKASDFLENSAWNGHPCQECVTATVITCTYSIIKVVFENLQQIKAKL